MYHSPAERSDVHLRNLRSRWIARRRLREDVAVAVLCVAVLIYFLVRALS